MNTDSPRITTEQIDLARKVSLFTVLGAAVEKDYFACCPIHKGDNPRAFHVWKGDNGERWHCFTGCGEGGDVIDFIRRRDGCSFADAVELLIGEFEPMHYVPQEQPKQKGWQRPDWSIHSTRYLMRWATHPKKYELWNQYKPLQRATIDAYQLGVGIVPQQKVCLHERLLVPVFEDGIMVSVRGRQIDCECEQKWLTAGGHKNAMYNLENIRDNGVVWVTGNNVDSLLLMERYPHYDAVSPLTGERTKWRKEWIAQLKAANTEQVIVAYDNDDTGLQAGVKLCNALHKAGIKARRWEWIDAPPKADIGWLLAQQAESAA